MGEHDGRDDVVVQVAVGFAAEQAIAQPPAGGDCDRRQRRSTGDIADRIDAGERWCSGIRR